MGLCCQMHVLVDCGVGVTCLINVPRTIIRLAVALPGVPSSLCSLNRDSGN